MQPCSCPRRAYFVRTRASTSEPLELNSVGKGGRAARPLAGEEKKIGGGRAVGLLIIDVAWAGPTAAGQTLPSGGGEETVRVEWIDEVLRGEGQC